MLVRITNNLIMLVFGLVLREYLTQGTLIIIGLGFIQSLVNIRVTKTIKNILSVLIFVLFVMSIRKFADPEGWLNFLTSFLILKTFEKDDSRDYYITFLGMILVLGVGSLFEKDIIYLTFFIISALVLVKNFYNYIGYKTNFKKMGGGAALTLPFVAFLFFVMPRTMVPINLASSSKVDGRIGYTPDVIVENIESLSGNQTPVFQAKISKFIEPNNLYWRGNVLSLTDGWNWPLSMDSITLNESEGITPLENEITQKIRLYNYQENFFGLDIPKVISYGGISLTLNDERSQRQEKSFWKNSYEVISNPVEVLISAEDNRKYLRVPLSRELKEEIRNQFKGKEYLEILQNIQNKFSEEKFTYSLAPGKIGDISDFLVKKTGFCSHYSSAVAIILRIKGIPTRLVSGFLGGQYNEFGEFYLVSQNDAHVWVEALSNGSWHRIDPTEWIVPDRIKLSGQDFIESREAPGVMGDFLGSGSRFRVVNQWFEQWNFAFYQWIDRVDYSSQLEFLKRLNLKRNVLYGFSIGAIFIFTFVYVLLFARTRKQKLKGIQKLWDTFFIKTNTKEYSISRMRDQFEAEKNQIALEILNELVLVSFNDQKISKSLKQNLRKL